LDDQQNRDRVHGQSLANAYQQLVEKLLQSQLGQRRVAQAIENTNLVGRGQVGRGRREHDLAGSRRMPTYIRAKGVQAMP
jgi:hypothetical protein